MTVGKTPGKGVGADAILDFSINVTLEGKELTERELRAILDGTEGLALVRGRWVEVDRERLRQVLDRWSTFEAAHAGGGLSVAEGLRLLAGADIDDGDAELPAADVAEWSKIVAGDSLAKALSGLRSPETLAEIDPGLALRAELRPYQKVGLRWLWWLRSLGLGGCLADDMGLGKTIQVIALLVLLKKKDGGANQPSLLVVPASLIANWRAEIARFAPSLSVFVAHPSEVSPAELSSLTSEALCEHDVVITTYGTLQRLAALTTRSWNVVVLDEAQAIKNPGAKQTRAAKALRAPLPPGAHRHAGREPAGRSLVAVRLHVPRPARLVQGVRSVRQDGREARARRLRSAARAGSPLHPPAAQERQARHRGSAGQDRGARVLRPHEEAGRPIPADGRRAARGAARQPTA